MPNELRSLKPTRMSLVPRPAGPKSVALLTKSDTTTEDTLMPAPFVAGLFAALKKALAPVTKHDDKLAAETDAALAEAERTLLTATAPDGDGTDADDHPGRIAQEGSVPAATLEKADVDALVAKAVEDVQKQLDAAKKDADEAKSRIEKMEHERAVAKAEADADTMLGALPGDRSKLASVLMKLDADEREVLAQSFRAGAEAIRLAAVTKSLGANATPDASSPAGQLNALAVDIRKADPSLTEAQAYTKACAQRPDLYDILVTKRES